MSVNLTWWPDLKWPGVKNFKHCPKLRCNKLCKAARRYPPRFFKYRYAKNAWGWLNRPPFPLGRRLIQCKASGLNQCMSTYIFRHPTIRIDKFYLGSGTKQKRFIWFRQICMQKYTNTHYCSLNIAHTVSENCCTHLNTRSNKQTNTLLLTKHSSPSVRKMLCHLSWKCRCTDKVSSRKQGLNSRFK